MLSHEALEQAAAAFLALLDVLFQCLYRHGADVAYREGSGDRNSQGESFDVAVELPGEHDCRLQRRIHEVVVFDRNENALEAHGPPPIRVGGIGSAKPTMCPCSCSPRRCQACMADTGAAAPHHATA